MINCLVLCAQNIIIKSLVFVTEQLLTTFYGLVMTFLPSYIRQLYQKNVTRKCKKNIFGQKNSCLHSLQIADVILFLEKTAEFVDEDFDKSLHKSDALFNEGHFLFGLSFDLRNNRLTVLTEHKELRIVFI